MKHSWLLPWLVTWYVLNIGHEGCVCGGEGSDYKGIIHREEGGNESQIGQNQQKVVGAEPEMKARCIGSSVLREKLLSGRVLKRDARQWKSQPRRAVLVTLV